MGGRGIRGLKARVGWKCCIGRGGQIEGRKRRAAPGVRAAKSSEFRERKQ